ncbi:C-type lectin mannose-binding isoform-like [Anneissia japonica]|uniref:C-type lectin mannose-binding isoform-like n=1 Tax=Anneissia japonica TaxID=1529436 RepID=UPI00142584CA|nr:C-type lectin mannose-binding isoform-like [Anneissia japonica]
MGIVLLLGIFIAVATSPSDATSCKKCPPYWTNYGHSCYRVFESLKTWNEAHVACSYLGRNSDLVSIESDYENNFVSTLWKTSHNVFVANSYTYWIGLMRSGSSWRWSNYSTSRYRKWGSGEPNNNGGNENCVHQWKKNGNYLTWNDIGCNNLLSYVCEMPPSY